MGPSRQSRRDASITRTPIWGRETRLKIGDFKARLSDLVARGASRAEIEQAVTDAAQAGVPAADLKHALDGFDASIRTAGSAALKNVIGSDSNVTLKRPGSADGKKAHEIKVQPKPWFAQSSLDLGQLPPALYPEPPKDVSVQGHRVSKDDVASLLRNVAKS
jgi:hypothetical protein